MNIFILATAIPIFITIYEVSQYKQSHAPLEDFNQLAWFPIEEAISKLKRGSHKWGIEMWKKNHKV